VLFTKQLCIEWVWGLFYFKFLLALLQRHTFSFASSFSQFRLNHFVEREKMGVKNVYGLCLAVISALLFTMNGVVVKKVKSLTPMELSFWRCTMQTIWVLPVVTYSSNDSG